MLAGSTSVPGGDDAGFSDDGWVGHPRERRTSGALYRHQRQQPRRRARRPASDALTATTAYGAAATPAAQLVGIPASGAGAIVYPIVRGDPVNLLVMEQDTVAQAALAALIGGDGVQEEHVSDNRLSATEARARARRGSACGRTWRSRCGVRRGI